MRQPCGGKPWLLHSVMRAIWRTLSNFVEWSFDNAPFGLSSCGAGVVTKPVIRILSVADLGLDNLFVDACPLCLHCNGSLLELASQMGKD